MSSSPLKRVIHPAIYAVALLWAFIEFIITAVLVHDYDSRAYPSTSIRDRLRFLLFVSIWSLVFLPVYIFANFKAPGQVLSSVASNLAFASLTWLFWLVGAASWTDALGGSLHCGNIFLANQVIDLNIPYCGSLRATQAFAWMEWITISAALGYVVVIAFKATKSSSGLTGPMREVAPATA